MYALEVKGLTKKYKNGRGIFEIDMNIEAGEVYGFLGPNGAGKTTAMKCMTGLIRPDQGEIRIFGEELNGSFEATMRKVGAIIESCEAYEYLSAQKNLELAARYYGNIPAARMDEVLELVGLMPYKKEKVAGFSLGMKQRLGIATAILHRPSLLILDEPGNGLDIEGMVEVRGIIRRLAQESKTTVLISSHQISELELVCSSVGIIREGRMLLHESMANLENRGNKEIQEDRENQGSREGGSALEAVYLEQIKKEKVS